MKETMWRSGFYGALSGLLGGLFACVIGLIVIGSIILVFSPVSIDSEFLTEIGNTITSHEAIFTIWVPGAVAGVLVGFISGLIVIKRPDFLFKRYIWASVGAITGMVAFLFVHGAAIALEIVFMSSLIGGLIAHFVYQRLSPDLNEFSMGQETNSVIPG